MLILGGEGVLPKVGVAEPEGHLICHLHRKLLKLIFLTRQLIPYVLRAHPIPQDVIHCGSSEGGNKDTLVLLVGRLIDQAIYSQISNNPISKL